MARLSDFIVEGYLIADAEQLEDAKKEREGVEYVRSRIDMNNPASVLKIYNKIIDQNMFKTQVGISFLRELQDYLYSCTSIDPENISAIPVTPPPKPKIITEDLADGERKKYKNRQGWLIAVIIALGAAIIIMFAIAASSGNPTILNYENSIIDKYSAWEADLKEREAAVKEKEYGLVPMGHESNTIEGDGTMLE